MKYFVQAGCHNEAYEIGADMYWVYVTLQCDNKSLAERKDIVRMALNGSVFPAGIAVVWSE